MATQRAFQSAHGSSPGVRPHAGLSSLVIPWGWAGMDRELWPIISPMALSGCCWPRRASGSGTGRRRPSPWSWGPNCRIWIFSSRSAVPLLSFVHHRGMTHSLLGGAGLALLGALLLWGCLREHSYWRLVLWTSLGVVLHIGMDVLTPYGTQVFWPFTARRYTADAVFILDYFYTGLMVLALLLIRMVRQQRQRQYGLRSLGGIGVGSALGSVPHGFPRVLGGSSRAVLASWWRYSWSAWCAASRPAGIALGASSV